MIMNVPNKNTLEAVKKVQLIKGETIVSGNLLATTVSISECSHLLIMPEAVSNPRGYPRDNPRGY